MQEDYYLGAYWGPRQETTLECARRAELFFHMLARCDPTFTQWYGGHISMNSREWGAHRHRLRFGVFALIS